MIVCPCIVQEIFSLKAPGYGGDGPCHGQVDCLLHTSSNGQANGNLIILCVIKNNFITSTHIICF